MTTLHINITREDEDCETVSMEIDLQLWLSTCATYGATIHDEWDTGYEWEHTSEIDRVLQELGIPLPNTQSNKETCYNFVVDNEMNEPDYCYLDDRIIDDLDLFVSNVHCVIEIKHTVTKFDSGQGHHLYCLIFDEELSEAQQEDVHRQLHASCENSLYAWDNLWRLTAEWENGRVFACKASPSTKVEANLLAHLQWLQRAVEKGVAVYT